MKSKRKVIIIAEKKRKKKKDKIYFEKNAFGTCIFKMKLYYLMKTKLYSGNCNTRNP